MSKIIVVIGVTGVQGSSVANTFLQFPDWIVRGITRNPSSPAAQSLSAKGVSLFQADLDSADSLSLAFEGATAIFSNTDFFAHLFDSKASADHRSETEYAFDREVEQGMNIAQAASKPEILVTLKHLIYSSLSDAKKWSGEKYARSYHHNSKGEVERHIHAELPELAERMSTLQVGHYVTNWKSVPMFVPQKQTDGSFVIQRSFSPELKMPFVAAHADIGGFVKALVEIPPGKALLGASEHMTWPQWTELWGQVLGVKATYKQVTEEEIFKDLPEMMKVELTETFRYVEEFGYTGGDPDVMQIEDIGFPISRTSMEMYMRSEDWSSVI